MFPSANRPISRRDVLRMSAGVAAVASVSGWFDALAVRALAAQAKAKACILLWMDGGPSQAHTFDLKDDRIAKGIDTSVPGIRISEHLPRVAREMQHLALLRSMHTIEANHEMGHHLMRTGFRRGTGGLNYPHMGAVTSEELGKPDSLMPGFVVIKEGTGPGTGLTAASLNPRNAPLILNNISKGLPLLRTNVQRPLLDSRAKHVDEADLEFMRRYQSPSIEGHRSSYKQALRMMHSAEAAEKPFKLEQEPEEIRRLYGDTTLGRECLLARRLLEAGVQFVEVVMPEWDTHGTADKGQPQNVKLLDGPFAALIADLKQRGMLDSTLLIWMGEFGRNTTGNDHWGKAWTTVLGGAGIKGGQVVGRTDKSAMTVQDRPIEIGDFMATIYTALGIDPKKTYVVQRRNIGLVPKNPNGEEAKLLKELF